MDNLFDTAVYTSMMERIKKLSPENPAQWGKMNVSQMMAHVVKTFTIPLSEKPFPRSLLGRIFAPFIKAKLYNEEPWKQNLPTAPALLIKDERDFNKEKENLINVVNKFYSAGPIGITKHPHPFFGKLTPEQWGMSMFKHLDHHLKQFGV